MQPMSISGRVETGVLIAFAFVLPLYEAPKNILWVVFVVLWLVNRWRARDFGGPWDRWDTLILLWIASGFATAAFAGIHHDEWRAAADIVRYGGVLWLLKRSRYPDAVWIGLAAAIVAGTVVALAWGYVVLPSTTHQQLEMNSVGHVNHSAIYLAIVFGLALAATRAWWTTSGWGLRAFGLALLAGFAISLQWMESRGAIGAAFLMAAVLLGVEAVRQRRRLRLTVLLVLAAAAVVMLLKPTFVEKNIKFIEAGKFLNVRDGTWRVGLSAWREFPLFGVGMDNYTRIRPEDVRQWNEKRGEAFDPDALLFTHGHSLYISALAERGLVGLGVLLAVLVAWAVALVRAVPGTGAPPLQWTYWGGAAGAWMITVVVGTVNTTLHHEHALVATLLLGGWLSLDRNSAP